MVIVETGFNPFQEHHPVYTTSVVAPFRRKRRDSRQVSASHLSPSDPFCPRLGAFWAVFSGAPYKFSARFCLTTSETGSQDC